MKDGASAGATAPAFAGCNADTTSAIVLSLIPHDMMYGPQTALIAASLFAKYHASYAISGYVAACAVISVSDTALMTDRIGASIASEYEDTGATERLAR